MRFSAIVRYLVKTGIVAALGVVAILISVPFARAHVIRWQTNRATLALEAGRPAEAVQRLHRLRAWTDLYPDRGTEALLALIRAHVQLGEMEQAFALARHIAAKPATAEDAARETPACLRAAEATVNRFYCRVDQAIAVHSARYDDSPECHTNAGFAVIRQELYRLGRTDGLPTETIPAPGAAEPLPNRQSTTPPHTPTPVAANDQTNATAADTQDTARVTTEPPDNSAELAARKEALATELEQLRKDLANLTRNGEDAALQRARKQVETAQRAYRDFIEQGAIIKRKMDAATGEERMIWLDQLRIRKGEEIQLHNALETARKTVSALTGNGSGEAEKIKTRIARLEEELRQIAAPPSDPSA